MKRTRNSYNNAHITAGVLSIAGCFLMAACPRTVMTGARTGIDLFMGSVLPTMFPFFVFVNFLNALGVPGRIGNVIQKPVSQLFRCSGVGGVILILSMFSGYPMAAKLVGDHVRNGEISVEEGKRILSFSCVSGPLFLIGTVGTAMLGNSFNGYLIAAGHYLGAFLNGLLFCHWILPRETMSDRKAIAGATGVRDRSLSEMMSSGIFSAVRSLIPICGFIILFSIGSSFLTTSGLLEFLPREWMKALIKGGLEMTLGCSAVSQLTDVTELFRLGLCSAIISFGGFSISGQSLSMLSDTKIKSSYYLCMKLCHGVIAFLLTMAFGLAANHFGFPGEPVSLIYGSDRTFVRVFGGLHTLLFSMGSVTVLMILMGAVVLTDHVVMGISRKFKERYLKRKENV